jgi:hypothetical protein
MSYPPKIRPQNHGLLHRELGIPEGEKIGERRLEAATRKGQREHNPALVKRAQFALNFNDHGHHGYVVAIRAHHSRPDYMNVEIAHGKRSRRTRADGGGVSPDYDDRPTSSLVLPKRQARHFTIGQKVGVGAVPLEGPDTDEMDDDGDDLATMKHNLTRDIARGRGIRKR